MKPAATFWIIGLCICLFFVGAYFESLPPAQPPLVLTHTATDHTEEMRIMVAASGGATVLAPRIREDIVRDSATPSLENISTDGGRIPYLVIQDTAPGGYIEFPCGSAPCGAKGVWSTALADVGGDGGTVSGSPLICGKDLPPCPGLRVGARSSYSQLGKLISRCDAEGCWYAAGVDMRPQSVSSPPPPSGIWMRYTLTSVANGVNGCANANGCWQVNGTLGANRSAGITQSVTLFTLPANSFVNAVRVKTATAFTGTATLTATLGTAGSATFFVSVPYNMQSAVSATNFSPASGISAGLGSATTASEAVVLALTSTVQNIDQISAGVVDVWANWVTLP